jgi:hypothetical protein
MELASASESISSKKDSDRYPDMARQRRLCGCSNQMISQELFSVWVQMTVIFVHRAKNRSEAHQWHAFLD